jgi:hypothetical protein
VGPRAALDVVKRKTKKDIQIFFTGYLASFGLCPSSGMWKFLQKTTTFRRLDLSPSSGGWGRINVLSWARQKELVSITGQTPVRRKQLINTRQPVIKLPYTRRWTESKRIQVVLYNIYHRQNPFKYFLVCYLTTLSVSRLYAVCDMLINEYGAVSEMRRSSKKILPKR